MTFLRYAPIATILAFGAFSTNSALALDANDFAAKLSGALDSTGMALTFGTPRADGNDVYFSEATFTPAGDEPQVLKQEVVFSDVKETADGGYTAQKAFMSDITFARDEYSVSVRDVTLENINLPGNASDNPLATLALYEHLNVGPISVIQEGQVIFTLQSVEALNKLDAGRMILTSSLVGTGLYLDLGKLGTEMDAATQFGVETIDARFEGESVWNIKTGELTVNKYAVETNNVGTLAMKGVLHGYDMVLVEELYEQQKKINAATQADADVEEIEARSMEILNKMTENLSIGSAEILFEDAGITGKILASIATQSGTTPDVMAAGLAATLPMMAGQFGAPETMQTMLMQAATAYLTQPENISISLKPENPVLIAKLSAALANPAQLISLLNITISANQ